ncbi:purine-cytosine permease family protein [Gryllotalpicola ginsengisoli]|uniref:purine-cytosine permease family protein n=1 Tax=Gryllotalpicola ginsengisoli TaxID=444608 RepID=UPI0003B4F9AC|nr:cytosine permease [Gryllotalpicola ginsengisoli]
MTSPSPAAARTVIEVGGIEAIPPERRHGSPWQLFATWTSPNLEFATVFVGMIAVAYFGLSLPAAILAIVVGNALGSLTQGILSTWGPREGLAQLVLSRTAFGTRGNILPAALNTAMAGLGWFATNSASGTLALSALTGMPAWLSLVIVVVVQVVLAFVGHDLVQQFERYTAIILGIIFLIAVIVIFAKTGDATPPKGLGWSFAGFTLTASGAFGYAAGWNPYASDYTRYQRKDVNRAALGWAAGLGDFISCTVLMIAGAASAYIAFNGDNPTDSFVQPLPTWIRDLTLLAICVGAIAANALNIYSGAMSFLAAGVKIPFALRRAIIAVGFGIVGFFIALAAVLNGQFEEWYENFLLVIAYWIAPWLGVVFMDRILRRGTSIAELIPESAKFTNWAGFIALIAGGAISIWLFSNQSFYTGFVAAHSGIGDLTPLVGFLLAAVIYWALFKPMGIRLGGPLESEPEVIAGVDAADEVA